MGCVSSTNYSILVNGIPTNLFKRTRGIKQECRLSPLLFLLIVEGLSRLINKANNEDTIKGLEVSTHHNLTHSLFVDDVLFFGNGTLNEWTEYLAMISLFYKASCIDFSIHKFIWDGRENNCGYL